MLVYAHIHTNVEKRDDKTHLINISQKSMYIQLTPKHVETQFWVMQTVWKQMPGRKARNSKTLTIKTIHTIARNDQLPLASLRRLPEN